MQYNSFYVIWYEFLICEVSRKMYCTCCPQSSDSAYEFCINTQLLRKQIPVYFGKAYHSPVTFSFFYCNYFTT
jgi:hypothetical protein